MRRATPFGPAIGAVLIALLAGCGARPQVLSLNYRIVEMPDVAAADALERQLWQGTARVEDQLQSPCNFTASFAVIPPPQLDARTTQGSNPERIEVSVPTPVNLATTNAPACPAVAAFDLRINGPIRLGVDTSRGRAIMLFASGEEFRHEDLFRARVSLFQPGVINARGAADFRFVVRPAIDSPRMLFVIGAFDLRNP